MKYKLHYADLNVNNGIVSYDFKRHKDLVNCIDDLCCGRLGECVWLITRKDDSEVYVSHHYLRIINFLQNMPLMQTTGNYFLFEYDSYESAYENALDMAEFGPMAYSNNRV